MAAGRTEYQEEYCGMGGKGGGRGGSKKGGPAPIVPCSKSEDEQPVGGRCAARYREALDKAAAERAAMQSGTAGTAQGAATKKWPMPAFDEDFVAAVYSKEDRGTHKAQPTWRDPRWSEPVRADNATLYEPADRDPCNRNNMHVYKSTLVDPLKTPCDPLPVPDVHKLRYMHNNYMTPDDWY